ncbi:MAG TPA: flagellar hook-associated protein FlgK [Tepidisphaeraceae bacterium]|jgi:flagellar hook-associated protein 1 FlgK|nr:flagellar hook-associated protein FlgK [Tepidisphaeraceae bacterium]
MSLNGALNIGASALTTAQAAMQVTGNNISNLGNANYSREVADITDLPSTEIQPGVYMGTGVDLSSIQRQVDESLNSRLNSAMSDYQSANTTQTYSGQIETIFNALGSQNLQTQMTTFTNDWSQLANDPTSTSQRQVVIQDGQSLAQDFNSLGSQLDSVQTSIGSQLNSLATNATQLAQQIATLNQQIATSQGAGGEDNQLLDQRDATIQQLAQLVNVQTVNQGNGTVNVYIGSEPLVVGTTSDGLTVQQGATSSGQPSYSLAFTSDGGTVQATSGQLGATLTAQTQLNTVQQQLNSLAGGLIFGLNSIYSSGQGLNGYTTVTGTNQVQDPTAVLNSSAAGLPFQPVNGSFVVTTTNTQTGLSSSTLVPVNLTGQPTDTTLNSLTASLNAIPTVQATIQGGKLTIASTDPNVQISFSQDSSHVLAALGINTFFQGSDANSIAVNSVAASNPNLLAAAQNGDPGDNTNALAIANFPSTLQSTLGNQSWTDSYNAMIGGIATTSAQAISDTQSTQDIQQTLQSQQQSVSGVNIDTETVHMLQQQRSYQGAAMFISTVNQMMTALMQITL